MADLKSVCVTVLLPDDPPPAIVAETRKMDPILATAVAGKAVVLCFARPPFASAGSSGLLPCSRYGSDDRLWN